MKEDLYEIFYDEETDGDLYAISIVDRPANKFEFIALSDIEEKKIPEYQIQLGSDKKRKILYGIVLRADQKIYREDENGNPFHISFNSDTIVKLSQDFFKKGFQNNSTFNHNDKTKLNTSTVVENWIVENKDMDKATHLGLKVENGDWIIGMKLGDEEWDKYIETGKAKGFSIDSFLKLKKVQMSDNPQDKMDVENKIKNKKMNVIQNFLKMFPISSAKISLAEIEVDGKKLIADEFKEGNIVYTDNDEVFVGEFEFEGNKITTDAEGKIVSIEKIEEDKPVEEELSMKEKIEKLRNDIKLMDSSITAFIELPVGEHVIAGTKYVVEEQTDGEGENEYTRNVIVEMVPVSEESKPSEEEVAMKTELSEIKEKFEKLKKELADFKSRPIVDKVKASPLNMSQKEVEKTSTLQVIERLRKNNKK